MNPYLIACGVLAGVALGVLIGVISSLVINDPGEWEDDDL